MTFLMSDFYLPYQIDLVIDALPLHDLALEFFECTLRAHCILSHLTLLVDDAMLLKHRYALAAQFCSVLAIRIHRIIYDVMSSAARTIGCWRCDPHAECCFADRASFVS